MAGRTRSRTHLDVWGRGLARPSSRPPSCQSPTVSIELFIRPEGRVKDMATKQPTKRAKDSSHKQRNHLLWFSTDQCKCAACDRIVQAMPLVIVSPSLRWHLRCSVAAHSSQSWADFALRVSTVWPMVVASYSLEGAIRFPLSASTFPDYVEQIRRKVTRETNVPKSQLNKQTIQLEKKKASLPIPLNSYFRS